MQDAEAHWKPRRDVVKKGVGQPEGLAAGAMGCPGHPVFASSCQQRGPGARIVRCAPLEAAEPAATHGAVRGHPQGTRDVRLGSASLVGAGHPHTSAHRGRGTEVGMGCCGACCALRLLPGASRAGAHHALGLLSLHLTSPSTSPMLSFSLSALGITRPTSFPSTDLCSAP